jgi:hypothetical protein
MPRYTVQSGVLRELDSDSKTIELQTDDETNQYELLPDVTRMIGWEDRIAHKLNTKVTLKLKDEKVYGID